MAMKQLTDNPLFLSKFVCLALPVIYKQNCGAVLVISVQVFSLLFRGLLKAL